MKNDEKAEGTLRYERCEECQYGEYDEYDSDMGVVWCKRRRKYFNAGDGCSWWVRFREGNVMPGTLRFRVRCDDCQYGKYDSYRGMVWCRERDEYFEGRDGCSEGKEK